LDDDYVLVNGVRIHGLGDVDHVVVGQTAFSWETKNWSGEISCNSDRWQRAGKPIEASPSRQAKTTRTPSKKGWKRLVLRLRVCGWKQWLCLLTSMRSCMLTAPHAESYR
jgi:hypothetical protein